MRSGRSSPVLAALLAAATAGALLSATAPAGARTGEVRTDDGFVVEDVTWTSCASGTSDGSGAPAGLQCARVEVPMDWDDPDGETIVVGLNRLPARDPDERLGSLVFNPGGPGGSGTEWVAAEAEKGGLFGTPVRERYDLIGYDPRGVATSEPEVRCDPALWNEPRVSLFPSSEAAYDDMVAKYAEFGASCLELTGPALRFMDTVSVARDLDAVRQALGESELTYLGLSYGTEIGQTYTQLFPENVGRMVLDGALEHSLPATVFNENETVAYESALRRFADWCGRGAECALRGEDVLKVFSDVVAAADRNPVPAADCRASAQCAATVTGEDIRFVAQGYLLFPDGLPQLGYPGWKEFGDALKAARDGDASGFSPHVVTGRSDPAFVSLAVGCLDYRADFEGYPALREQAALGRAVAPHVRGAGQSWTYLAQCAQWPAEFTDPPEPPGANGARVLIVNALYDPSTAYTWARLMVSQMPESVLLTRDGDGHTSYPVPGRARDLVDRYLTTGALPDPGTFVK